MHERQVFGRSVLLFDRADREQLAALGEVRRPSIADLFVAVMGKTGRPAGRSCEMNLDDVTDSDAAGVDDPGTTFLQPGRFIGRCDASCGRTARSTSRRSSRPAVALLDSPSARSGCPERRRACLLLDPELQRARIEQPYDIAAMMLMVIGFVVGVFYCLDALHGERRDRSILFWKSLPVSDLTTVLSKASIPLARAAAGHLRRRGAHAIDHDAVERGAPLDERSAAHDLRASFPFFSSSLVLLYGLAAMALWHAPIYGWFLLVSAWARRAAILWALLPVSIGVVERIAFQTTHFPTFLNYRVFGGMTKAFAFKPKTPGPHGNPVPAVDPPDLTPLQFLISPGLWLGLLVAAVFLFAAVRLRRSRGPL